MSCISHSDVIGSRPKQWEWRKPKDKPRRNLSAYNYFFAETRKQLIDDRLTAQMRGIEPANDPAELGFSGMARTVAAKWKVADADVKAKFSAMAETDRERYKEQLAQWNGNNKAHSIDSRPSQEAKPVTTAISAKVITTLYPPAPIVQSTKAVTTPTEDNASSTCSVYVTKARTTSARSDDTSKMKTVFERSEGHHHLVSRETSLDHTSGRDNVDGMMSAGDRKHKFLPRFISDSHCTKKSRFSDQPMGYDATLCNDSHYSSSLCSDANVQVHLEQETASSRLDHCVFGGKDDLSAAALEPLSLQDEIARSVLFGFDGEEGDRASSSPHLSSHSPSIVDRLLSVLNKEDCELLVRHFSE